ncbi:cytochrome P450 [Phanerochaete sordida]|uniref:Cytochrome P450 n=1 Tax=Phanerochaete sordida TaxID=48140 RepID=A0A9P3FXB4_9APHY|nr:cytochrome P450 [Phanerochaete sordida]
MGLSLTHTLLAGQLVQLVAPAFAVWASVAVARRLQFLGTAPVGVDALIALIAIPAFHIGRARWQYACFRHKAARLGATLPPLWGGKLLANFDVIRLLDKAYREGFLSDHLYEKFDELGPTYNLYVLWDSDYCTTDAAVIKSVLATDFNNWVKGERFDTYVRSVLGTGVFNSDGRLWKFHRSMTRPFFARERISDFETFSRHAEEAVGKMKERLREGYAVDFADLISRFTMDAASEFLFGACLHSVRGALPYPHDAPAHLRAGQARLPADAFADAYRAALRAISHRARLVWLWPWFELFQSRTDEPMREIDRWLAPIIQKALGVAQEAEKQGTVGVEKQVEEDETLLDHLAKCTTDPNILHDEILNILLAGRDTTAGTLTFVIYFLSQHPDVLRRLRQEIIDTVGPTNRPSYDDIKQMKYLRAVLNETMRLYPSVPWNIRYAVEDAILPNSDPSGKPWFIPAGASVSYSVHCMHRRKDYWGPDADEFDPDRFLDARLHKYLMPNPFIFLPFNAGPRICLGQQFAYNEMSFFVVKLLQAFDDIAFVREAFDPAALPPAAWAAFPGRKGKEKVWPRAHVTVYSEGGMWVKMREAPAGQIDAEA